MTTGIDYVSMLNITNINSNSNTNLNISPPLKEIKANNDSNNGIHSGTVSRTADSGLRAYENHTFR